jgi:hypothetical protein
MIDAIITGVVGLLMLVSMIVALAMVVLAIGNWGKND